MSLLREIVAHALAYLAAHYLELIIAALFGTAAALAFPKASVKGQSSPPFCTAPTERPPLVHLLHK
jgi:hypothetical protein